MREPTLTSETWTADAEAPTLPLMLAASPPASRTRVRVCPERLDATAIWDVETLPYSPPRRRAQPRPALLAPREVSDPTLPSARGASPLVAFFLQLRCMFREWRRELARRFAATLGAQ